MDSNCFLSSTVKLTFGDSRPRFMGIFLPFLNFGIMPVSRYKKHANYLIFCKKVNFSANVFLGQHTRPVNGSVSGGPDNLLSGLRSNKKPFPYVLRGNMDKFVHAAPP